MSAETWGWGLDVGFLGPWGGKGALRVWCSEEEEEEEEEGFSPSSCSREVEH